MLDMVVAGGGPVGLATALYAHRAGLQVAVHEPRAGSIDKACGEGLMPGAVAALGDLGINPEGQPLVGIRYLAGDASAQAPFRHGEGRGVRRTTLHAELLSQVQRVGIPVVQRAVKEVAQRDSDVLVDGTAARYLVAADGLHSPLRRRLGLDAPVRPLARRFGLRCHADIAPWTDHVEVHWARSAEAYVTPVGPDLVGVAMLTSDPASFDEMLLRFPAIGIRLAGAGVSKVRGAGPLRQRSVRRVAGRVLLVGDASGYVDALTGEGIALGLAQARAAVAAISADRAELYEASWRRITWRYRLLTASLLGASRLTLVRRGIVPAASALPRVFAAAVNELARPA